MPTPRKEAALAQLTELLGRSSIAILTGYQGLSVAEMGELRRKLRQAGMDYHVVKNTLASFAAERTGRSALKNFLEGPTAIAFGYGEPTESAKVLSEHLRSTRIGLLIRGAVIGDRALGPAEVLAIAALPPREVLQSQVLAAMQAPLASLIHVLNGNILALLRLLQGRVRQLELAS